MRLIRVIILVCVFLLAGCDVIGGDEKPFIFSYEFDSIETQHKDVISKWLANARAEEEIKVFSNEIDGYRYTFVPTYKDVEISFIYSDGEGSLKQRFIKGTSKDELFVKIKFNTTICCNRSVYETDDSPKNKDFFED